MGGGPRWQDYAKALQENDRTIFLNQRLPLKFYYRTANGLLKQTGMAVVGALERALSIAKTQLKLKGPPKI